MDHDFRLPVGHELPDGSEIVKLCFSGVNWQIVEGTDDNRFLLALAPLVQSWGHHCLLDRDLFEENTFNSGVCFLLKSPRRYELAPVEKPRSILGRAEALAFAVSLRETRKICKELPLHDGIFVEQYSRILPTASLTPSVSDDVILGGWLTGGVGVSVFSFERLCALAPWLAPVELAHCIVAADLPEPAGINLQKEMKDSQLQNLASAPAGKPVSLESSPFTLPGRPGLASFFNDHIIDIIFEPEKYAKFGVDFPAPMVLHGPQVAARPLQWKS